MCEELTSWRTDIIHGKSNEKDYYYCLKNDLSEWNKNALCLEIAICVVASGVI